ncbi:unnamed protein product, partial [Prorocentrum cordatum]
MSSRRWRSGAEKEEKEEEEERMHGYSHTVRSAAHSRVRASCARATYVTKAPAVGDLPSAPAKWSRRARASRGPRAAKGALAPTRLPQLVTCDPPRK